MIAYSLRERPMVDAGGGAADSAAVRVSGLTKSFPSGWLSLKRRSVLRGLDFVVQRNEIFGYLGPNGSGKTTTLKILMGLLFPDSGSVTILGSPLSSAAWRYRCGFLPENPYFYDYLTAGEYLDYVGRLFGLPAARRRERSRELLERVGLAPASAVPLRRYSKGMLQRLGIAQALVNDPELVFLDEPMSGLDPIGRHLARNLILELKRAGKTVFFSTHILSDAETLCDRVALLRSGELLKAGRIDEILGLEVTHLEMVVSGVEQAALAALPRVKQCQPMGERFRLELEEAALGAVVGAVERAGGRVLSVDPVRQSLEEYFFKEMAGSEGGGRGWGALD
jgi:ABC-2 type transport system ATP-binding protein